MSNVSQENRQVVPMKPYRDSEIKRQPLCAERRVGIKEENNIIK